MCLPLYQFSQLTNEFLFVTDTDLYMPLIWVSKLCVPLISEAVSKLL